MTRVAKPVWVLVTLILAACVSLAGEQKAESSKSKEAKASKPVAERPAQPPVSPIYQAAQAAEAARGAADEESGEESVVITNADLERMWAGLSPAERMQGVYQAERHIGEPAQTTEPAKAPAPGSGQQGSIEWMEQRQAAAAGTRTETAEAEKKVAEQRAKVQDLERRLLAVRNPLLPRRYSDRKDEDNKDWDEMKNPERVATTEEELKKAKDDLAGAEQELARLRGSAP